MAARSHYEELARQLSAIGAVKRGLARALPVECPSGTAAVLTLLDRHGEMRISRLAELLSVNMSVTSRHVAHAAERGWIKRSEDPSDKRSRILRLTPDGDDMLDELTRRTTEAFAQNLGDWSDKDVGRLNSLLSRLQASFACRSAGGCTPTQHSAECPNRQCEDPYTRTPV